MDTQKKLELAQGYYQSAENELMRPAEDVVIPSACYSIKCSLRNFFEAYLDEAKIPFSERDSLQTLHEKCAFHDPGFCMFGLNGMQCRCEMEASRSSTYCMDVKRVIRCDQILQDIRDYMQAKGEANKLH
jgi:hypothetical protein